MIRSGDQLDRGSSKASIQGGFWISVIAIVVAFMALQFSWYGNRQYIDEAADLRAKAEALENSMREVVMEKRLLQEDLIMLRAALRAHGVEVETAGDHE